MGQLRASALCVLAACGRFGFDGLPAQQPPDVDASAAPSDAAAANGPTNVNLTSHWSFDGSLDDVVSGNNGTCTNCPVSGPGVIGNAAVFSGTECVTVPGMQAWSDAAFTISAWIQSPGMSGPVVVHESSSGCPSPEMKVENGLGLVQLNTTDSTPHNEAWTPSAIAQPGTWHELAVSWDGANQTVYVDGLCSCSEPQALGPLDHAQPFTIGCYPGDGTMFTGSIDEIRVYDRALTGEEMAGLYAIGGRTAPSPITCAIACATAHP